MEELAGIEAKAFFECWEWMGEHEGDWDWDPAKEMHVATIPESEVPPIVLDVWEREREMNKVNDEREALLRSMGIDYSEPVPGEDDVEVE